MFKIFQDLFKSRNTNEKKDVINLDTSYEEKILKCQNDFNVKVNSVKEQNEPEQINENFTITKNVDQLCNEIGENKYIKVKEKNMIYSEGSYVVGQDGLLPGVYYAWDDFIIRSGRNKTYYSGDWRCDDEYIELTQGKKVIIERGKITPIDNISYTYNNKDYLVPGHIYLVGKEIPHGKYRILYDETLVTSNYCSEEECIFHRINEKEKLRAYSIRRKDGFAETDSRTDYVVVENGKAILVEEGVSHPNNGPEAEYNFMMKQKEEKKIENFRNEMRAKCNLKDCKDSVVYYCAIKDPIAEIVILEYFSKFAKVEKIKNLFQDDFSINYKIEIITSMIDLHCLLYCMFLNKVITAPATFGVVIADVLNGYNVNLSLDREKIHEISLANLKKRFPYATDEEIEKFKSKMEIYRQKDDSTYSVKKILKSRISLDVCKVITQYCKIYPFQVIDNESYYVTSVPGKYVEQYFDNKCPRFLCYHAYEKRNEYEKKYSELILDLKEQGIIKSKWKNEFALYMLVKSYFPSAIYQYHDDWLEKQSLDVYIPELKIGFEYQGKQHYEEVGLFNGAEGLIETQKRDELKKEKCKLNDVTLVEWKYSDEVDDRKLIDILEQLNISIPKKQDTATFYKTERNKPNKCNKREVPKICQYDLDGNYLNLYDSVEIASCETGVSKESIRRVCSGVRNTGGGYMWRRFLQAEIPKKIAAHTKEEQTGMPRKIIQYDIDGNIIASYDSVAEAVRNTGINAKSIRETAKGKQNHAGGYVWKYADSI